MKLSIATLRRRRRPDVERARLNHPGYSCCECTGRRLVGWRVGRHRAETHAWQKVWGNINQCAICHLLHRTTDGWTEEKHW